MEIRKKSATTWTHGTREIILSKGYFRIETESDGEYFELTEPAGSDNVRAKVIDVVVIDDTGAGTPIPFADGIELSELLSSLSYPFFKTASGGSGAISDEAYGSSWDGETTEGASKNSLYDVISTLGGAQNLQSVLDNGKYAESLNTNSYLDANVIADVSAYFEYLIGDGTDSVNVNATPTSYNLTATDGVDSYSLTLTKSTFNLEKTDANGNLLLRLGSPTATGVNVVVPSPSSASASEVFNVGLSVNGVKFDADGDVTVAAGSGVLEYQTPITIATTVFDGTQKGLNKIYVFESDTAQTVQIDTGDYVLDDVINLERRGAGTLEVIWQDGIKIYGVCDADNRFFINDEDSAGQLRGRAADEFTSDGNFTDGRFGRIANTVYGELVEDDVAKDVTVTCDGGFSANMQVTVTGNATETAPFTYVSSTEITLHLTSTGTSGQTVTVTYFNSLDFVDTNAITLAAADPVPVANIYAYYPMDTNADDVVNAYNGTSTATTFTNTGVLDDCATMGAGDIDIPDNADFSFTSGGSDRAGTIMGYFYFTGVSGNDDMISMMSNTTTELEYRFYISGSTNELVVIFYNSNSLTDYIEARCTFNPTLSQFYYLGFTYDGSESETGITIYVDAVAQSSTNVEVGTYTGQSDVATSLVIGKAGWTAGNYLNGRIDELAFLNIECTLAQIVAMKAKIDGGTRLPD